MLSQKYPGVQVYPEMTIPSLATGNTTLDSAFRIALGDIAGNIVPYQDGLLTHKQPALLAGLDYTTPWTRDTAINTWNGAALLFPEVTYNTLLSVLTSLDGQVRIAGQYWDAMIWTLGAWAHYLATGDTDFLSLAFTATRNSLIYFEHTEFDAQLNLFRGPACYGDGVAAYPDIYAQTNDDSSILTWPACNPQLRAPQGYGLPMHALSTNCLYYQAYHLLEQMALELSLPSDPSWSLKAQKLKQAINTHFWNAETGRYRYLVDPFGGSEAQEGLGASFALLFGIANVEQAASLFDHQYISEHGIPCLWPNFARYANPDGESFGRHSGTVWPHIQAFWAEAAARAGKTQIFAHELFELAEHVLRDGQFAEVYHPITGESYGGLQEGNAGQIWKSCQRQTWSATGFLRMILNGLLGITMHVTGLTFSPVMPSRLQHIVFTGLPYHNAQLDIEVQGTGTRLVSCMINGEDTPAATLSANAQGSQHILLRVE